jgi:hypothetical protein
MGFKVTYNNDKLKELQRKAKDFHGERNVPLPELMPNDFIRKHTDFPTLQEMFDASGIDSAEEIDGEEFSKFVASRTRFDNWKEMLKAAGVEYARRQLGL